MNLRTSTRHLFFLAVITACTAMLHASEISGHIPFVEISVSDMGGGNLETATTFSGTTTLTSGTAADDFSIIPLGTSFGPFSLTVTAVSTGGGFSISNLKYGTFVATDGHIVFQTTDFLVVFLTGTYTPGTLFDAFTVSPADAKLAFTQSDTSISASFAVDTTPIPESGTLVNMGIGLCCTALILRRKPRQQNSGITSRSNALRLFWLKRKLILPC